MEGDAAPDLQAHETICRPDLAHGHESGEAGIKKLKQGFIPARCQKDLRCGVFFRHTDGEEIHQGGLRFGIAVMFRFRRPAFPPVAVKGTVAFFSIVDKRLAQHGLLVDIQEADEFRLCRNVFLDQLRPDLSDFRRFSELRQSFPVEIREG